MLELRAIADRVGLSEHQTRRVLRALAPVLESRTKRGRDNRILIDTNGLAIIERGVELWKDGNPLNGLCDAVTAELADVPSARADGVTKGPSNPTEPKSIQRQIDFDPTAALVDLLKQQIEHQNEELLEMRRRLQALEERVPALPSSSESRKRLTVGERIRAAFTGRM